ncbi:7022_t:CDS:2, partial [Funneliformis caledonium]
HIATFPSATNLKLQPADKIGICNECNKKRPNKNWCKPCYSSHFKKSFNKWTSGSKILNKFIHKSQLSSTSRTSCLEWIPRYHLTDVELLSKNNYCSVYSAIWVDGFIVNWNKDDKCWNRCSGVKVILKTFTKIDNDVSTDFLHEPKAHLNCCVQNACITSFYGFTLDPITNEYLMVLEYAPNGTLRDYIQKNIGTLDWKRKSLILQGIASGLRTIHSANLIHELVHITEELSLSMSYKKIGLPEKVLLENKMMESLKNIHPSAVYSSRLLPTLYDIHIQDDNEDNDQWSEYDSEPLIVLKNDNLL